MALDKLLRQIAGAVAAVCLATGVFAQTAYPTKPVKIIVPFSAGGPADIYARYLGQQLEKTLGHPIVVEDRVGGGGVIGADAVAKSAPDGYTLLMMSNTHTVNESLISKKPYNLMTDLLPIAPGNYSDLLLVVHPSVPAKNLKELLALAKAEAGTVRAIASSGRTRSAVTPGIQTISEAGVPGYDAVIWLGLMAPAGTPKPIVEKLNSEIQRVTGLPEVK